MDDKKDPPEDMLKNLDLLMNWDLVQAEDKWPAMKAMSDVKDAEPETEKEEDKKNGD